MDAARKDQEREKRLKTAAGSVALTSVCMVGKRKTYMTLFWKTAEEKRRQEDSKGFQNASITQSVELMLEMNK